MSNPGEWIDFAELCRRVPTRSAATLRRLYKHRRQISYRQLVPGGPVEFNWRTVERELRRLETPAFQAGAARLLDDVPADVRAELAAQRQLLETIAGALGIVPFAGEHHGRKAS